MPKRPTLLLDRPKGSNAQTTDVLADILATMHLSTLIFGRLELGAPWGFQFPDIGAAHLYVVARGGARLEVQGIGAPIALSAGDIALLPHGGPHALRDAPRSRLRRLAPAEWNQNRVAEPMRLGRNRPPA